ncbi:glycoside hydrolase family 31 protein [Streptomyces pinistramenti]|uniref:glycoside hydrolase family 31 protein n=1 Tax=Streptomyces pinistramenti TaxID=2884812 RepID=UPI001D05F6B0|nr:glycoside hydrolase family 31 protein [Streptomyces pinistramenti]MCB5910628.1 glycoside hydrolase family 31 protein [Streptomyces pinistramenti]
MNGRDLVRSVRVVRAVGAAQGLRSVRAAWQRRRADAVALPRSGQERARVPGEARGAEPQPGGGLIHFARSSLRVRVATGGAVFCGWDGAGPEPSYALAACPEVDGRAVLEPDTEGGWRVVSERVMVAVSRHGAVEVRTPGGALLRRELPPRWWDRTDGVGGADEAGRTRGASEAVGASAAGGAAADGVHGADSAPGADGAAPGAPSAPEQSAGSRWVQRSEVAADARFFGLGGRAGGPRLRDGAYRLWNTGPGEASGPDDVPLSLTMPVQLVVADAGTHLVFHDNSWDGWVTLREGREGAGSGHDRMGTCALRMDGGPLRYWVLAGTPARVLLGWAALTGAAAVPPRWALGYQHARQGFGGAAEVRRVVAGYREHGLPLSAVHLDIGHHDRHRVFTVDRERYPDLPGLARELRAQGVRLVSVVHPAVRAQPGEPVYDSGLAAGAFVRDARGREVRGVAWPGASVFPDFTDPAARKWWGGLYAERLEQGFTGVWHDMNEPAAFAAFGEPTLPRSARHVLDGRGGDHREAHNVYALEMARAGYEGLSALRPDERPFLFSRSGWAGMQRYGGAWPGDVATGWPGLRASLALVLGLGLCGVPYSGPDAGGFSAVPSRELYLRWFQLAAYLPLFRTHAADRSGRREPWEFGPEVLTHARAALRERERLLPYFESLGHLARLTGAPYVRPVWWHTPRDRALRDCGDAFLLGHALLVAPVLEPGGGVRAVRLPRGRWYDTATGQAYEGPGEVRVDAPLSRIPVLARAGAVLPVTGADGGTELEVWAPTAGRNGGGSVAADAGGGQPVVERFVSRLAGGQVVVERQDGSPAGYPVRVRGAAG